MVEWPGSYFPPNEFYLAAINNELLRFDDYIKDLNKSEK